MKDCEIPGFMSLMPGERVVCVTHPSAWNYFWTIVFGVILIPVLVGLVMLLYVYVMLKTTAFVVTDKRVVAKTGVFSVNMSEVRIEDVRGVNLSQSLWQRIIDAGTVFVGTAATGGAEIVMNGIASPKQVVASVNAQRG